MEKTLRCIVFLILVSVVPAFSQDKLAITTADVVIETGSESGYYLWIKKKPGVGSVLLTETTADPAKMAASYALRNPAYHPVNGTEKRMLDGKLITPESKLYSLIDSTSETHPTLGDSFRIFLPFVVVYGYSWARHGEIQILDGTFINIRTFEKPFGDYTGAYKDNPFKFQINQIKVAVNKNVREDTLKEFTDIANEGGGLVRVSKGGEDIFAQMDAILGSKVGDSLDLVLAIDTTASMEDDMVFVKQALLSVIEKYRSRYKRLRVGLVFYKDYYEQYVTKEVPFSEDYTRVSQLITEVSTQGGRDIPEAVYEALYSSVKTFSWEAQIRLTILIGDAPPHPIPRGDVTKEKVFSEAEIRKVEVHTIILPE
ncbi:MAG: VWA domain-containing protein [Spirochaetaceae bacterium]|nr:MAG: VWA domain-containing protein [Spirochaetaceae bacterium]